MGKKEQDKRADMEKNTEGEGKGGLYPLLKKMKDERIQTAIGLVLLTFGLYLALAFVSFFFTGWQDQSLLQNTQGFTLDYINENVRNWAGLRGAKLADFFINHTFGICCLLYLFYYFLCALWLMHIRPFRMCRTFLMAKAKHPTISKEFARNLHSGIQRTYEKAVESPFLHVFLISGARII